MVSSRKLAVLAAGSLLLPAGLVGQTRKLTFGSSVEVIRLSLSVTDTKNRLITGLAEADFAVFEDNVKQDVAFFTPDPLPLSVALLVDCSASMEEKLTATQQAATRFVRTLRPEDLGQVSQFNDRLSVLREFTADHDALEAAIHSTHASGTTALYTTLYVTLKQLERQGTPDAPRRRAIVLLSDGEDTASSMDDEQVLDLARRADVAVYAICLRPERPADRQSTAYAMATHFLTAISRDTGGEAHFPNSLAEMETVYGRIADELRSQYTLGYVPRNDRHDGKWRKIVVRTTQREDLLVRHKIGYFSSKG